MTCGDLETGPAATWTYPVRAPGFRPRGRSPRRGRHERLAAQPLEVGLQDLTPRHRGDPGLPELVRKLAQPGCLLCREAAEAEERFFLWYLAESYLFPESLDHMIRAHGFCSPHTRTFLEDGIPSTIAYVYRFLAASARDAVETVEGPRAQRRKLPYRIAALCPTASCLACVRQKAHLTYVEQLLARLLRDPKVRPELPPTLAVCLPHLRALAPFLDPQALQLLATGLRERLAAADPRAALSWTWGAPPPPTPPTPEICVADERSTTLDVLRKVLAAPGCAVCRAEAVAVGQYNAWLEREIRTAPNATWRNGVALCPSRGWQFARSAAQDAVAQLGAAVQLFWTERLAELAEALTAAPTGGLGRRWAFVPATIEGRHGSRREAFLTAVGNALRSPRRTTRTNADRAFRCAPCPVCHAAETARERTLSLIAASLGDPGVEQAYKAGDGVCWRHLPGAVTRAQSSEAALALHTARVRLAVLNWELEEYLRKQSWDTRHEARGPEGGAWQRAARLLSGVDQAP